MSNPSNPMRHRENIALSRGFTVIELLVVLAAIGLLLSIVAPRYVSHVDRARESVLRHNLSSLRTAIDQYRSDRDRYPSSLQELVAQRYLRQMPVDPVTDRVDTWVVVGPRPSADGEVADVRSGAAGMARDGSPYASW